MCNRLCCEITICLVTTHFQKCIPFSATLCILLIFLFNIPCVPVFSELWSQTPEISVFLTDHILFPCDLQHSFIVSVALMCSSNQIQLYSSFSASCLSRNALITKEMFKLMISAVHNKL